MATSYVIDGTFLLHIITQNAFILSLYSNQTKFLKPKEQASHLQVNGVCPAF